MELTQQPTHQWWVDFEGEHDFNIVQEVFGNQSIECQMFLVMGLPALEINGSFFFQLSSLPSCIGTSVFYNIYWFQRRVLSLALTEPWGMCLKIATDNLV